MTFFDKRAIEAARDAVLLYLTGTVEGDGPRAAYDTAADQALEAALSELDRNELIGRFMDAAFPILPPMPWEEALRRVEAGLVAIGLIDWEEGSYRLTSRSYTDRT